MWKDAWSAGGAVFPSADDPVISILNELKGPGNRPFFILLGHVDL